MKRRKKITSLILTVSMCLTLVSAAFPMEGLTAAESDISGRVITGENGINLVNNGGFEHGDTEVEAWGKNDVEINSASDFIHSGAKSLKVAAGRTATAYAFSGLNATYNLNAAVHAGMWVYLSEAADAEKTLIVLERKGEGDNNLLIRPQAQVGWQKVVLTGGAIEGCTEHVIKFEVSADNAGDIYFDDAFVYSEDAEGINLIRNDGFENGMDAYGQGGDGTSQIVSDEKHGGNQSLAITGAKDVYQASGWWPNKQSANTGETLYYSAWVKSVEAAGSLSLRAEVKYGSPEQVVNCRSEASVTGTSDWTQLYVAIPYPSDYIHEILFHVETTDGSGSFYVDDLKVSAVDPAAGEVVKTPGEVNTGETGYNLLNNPGLERLRDGGSEPFQDWGSAGIFNAETADTRTGTGAVYSPNGANNGGVRYLFSGLNRYIADYTKELRASVWVKLEDASDAAKVKLICERKYTGDQQNFIKEAAATTEWQQIVLEMGEVAGCNEAVLKLEIEGTAAQVWADDFYLSTKDQRDVNFLRNGKFEDGTNAWANVDGTYVSGEGIEGSTALSMELGNAVDYFQSSAWWGEIPADLVYTNREDMVYSVKVRSAGGNGVFRLRVERKEGNPELVQEFTIAAEDTEWREVSLLLPALSTAPTEGLFHIEPVSGSGLIYFDDAKLALKEGEDPGPDPGPVADSSTEDRTPGTVVTGETGENALLNPGFELGEQSWGFVNASVSSDTVKTHSGAKAAVTSGNSNGAVWNVLPSGIAFSEETIRVTGYIWLNDAADAGKVHPKFKYENNGTLLAEYAANALEARLGWQKIVIDVPARKDLDVTTAVLVVDFDEGAKSVYLDDFFVQTPETQTVLSSNYVTNGNFEQINEARTEVAHWGLMPGWETVPGAIVTEPVYEGSYAVRVPQADVERYLAQSSNWIDKNITPVYDPGKPMLLTAKVYYENLTEMGASLKIETKRGSSTAVTTGETLTGSSNGWKTIELYLAPSALSVPVDEIIVGINVTAGSGVIYVDDVTFMETALRDNGEDKSDDNTLKLQDVKQTGFNWLGNPGFELDLQDWGVIGNANIVRDAVHGGSKALRAEGEANIWNVVSLNLNRSQELVLSFWAKFTDVSDVELLQFYISRKTSNEAEIERLPFFAKNTTEWQKVSVVIPACARTADILVVGADTLTSLSGYVYLDDFYLTYHNDNPKDDSANLVANGSFEFGNDGKPLAWGAIPEYGAGTNWVTTAREGKLATALTAKSDSSVALFQSTMWGNNPSYDYGAPLLLTAYVKTSVLNNGCFFKVERKYKDKLVGDATLSQVITGTTDGWSKVELYVAPTKDEVDEVIVGVELLPGSGSVLVDDIRMEITQERAGETEESGLLKNPSLEKLNPDGSILHWDVWPGKPEEGVRKYESVTDVVHSGQRALKIELVYGNGQAVYQYRVMNDNPFDFNRDYEASVWVNLKNVAVYDGKGVTLGVKRKDAAGNEYNVYTDIPLGSTDGWVQVKLQVPKAKADIIQYDVIVDIGAGSGVIYLDDFDLVETEIEPEKPDTLTFDVVDKDNEKRPEEQEVLPKKNLALPIAGGIALAGIVAAGVIVLVTKKRKKDK